MNKISTLNRSLLLMLVFTAISSFIAYKLVLNAYDFVFESENIVEFL